MSRQYSHKRFLRQVPNALLRRYFDSKDVLTGIDFSSLTETKIEPIYEAYLELNDEIRNSIERDFQQIDEMATEGGSKAILDEARRHGEDLSEQFALLKGVYEHAFWAFLERPEYWTVATYFYHADSIPFSYWRKRKNLPNQPAQVDKVSITLLEAEIGQYFHLNQGRGKNCKVEVYKRNDMDYFFAYPEDYIQASVEWKQNELYRGLHRPAFEIIFVYSQSEHTLDIYVTGDRSVTYDLQYIFAETILKLELPEDDKDNRIYDLSPFMRRDFRFMYSPTSGIENVHITKLRIKIYGLDLKVTLEADNEDNTDIYDSLDKLTAGLSKAQWCITQVGIKAVFNQNTPKNRKKTIKFNLTWPNSCSLKYDEQSQAIRKVLADSGIELKSPETAAQTEELSDA